MLRLAPSWWLGLAILLPQGLIATTTAAEGVDASGVAFFEGKIRPVLVKECYACHSSNAKSVKGGLRLDTRASLLAGGDSGPAVVPGKPDESPLLEALRHDGIAMPPRGKLPDAVVAQFEHWIKIGAPDPRDGQVVPTRGGIDLEAGRRFWAYQPPRRREPPAVRDARWPRSPIDPFVLRAQEAHGLAPNRDADRATLARRLSFDLTGLPPSPEVIAAFVADPSPTAYERFVDRLLGSPHFGERWGRHWLDVVRFAESLTLRGFVFKDAWRYRDYVIDAFNADLPFDQFLAEQVAGDLLDSPDLSLRRRRLVALTFLTLGNTNLEEQDKRQLEMDVVDEQVDTIGKAFLAQTIGCARCHDHKFDPIPTRDYYALAGILKNTTTLEHANVSHWLEQPLPVPPDEETILKARDEAVAALEARLLEERGRARVASSKAGAGGASRILAPSDLPGVVVDDIQARKVGEWKASQFSGSYIGRGYLHDLNAGKGEKTLTFQPDLPDAGTYEVRLAYQAGASRSAAAPVTVFSADGESMTTVDMRAEPPIDGRFVSLGEHAFEKNGQGYVLVSNEGTTGHVVADAVVFLPVARVRGGSAATAKSAAMASRSVPAAGNRAVEILEAELRVLRARGPRRERVMTVREAPKIEDVRIHVRGSVHNLGAIAPRGFLQVASQGTTTPPSSSQSGRRELADWITSRQNPLTARVIVNRAWHWLFGAGLVRTPDNFGTTGETPSHPELLDDLAVRFMDQGWSIKRLVRSIVLSRAYQLAGDDTAEALAIDPEDRFLWRMNRRRLDAECLRDAILATSGQLDRGVGGPSFPDPLAADYGFSYRGTRRSVYAPVFRNALPDLFEVFDFADPSMVVGRRNISTVAPQALFLMNNPFVIEQSRAAARRLLADPGRDATDRASRAYRLTLGRSPTPNELRLVLDFVGGAEPEAESWALVFQSLYASADFRTLD